MLYHVLDKPNSPPVLPAHPPFFRQCTSTSSPPFPLISSRLFSSQWVTKSFSARCNFPWISTTPSIKS